MSKLVLILLVVEVSVCNGIASNNVNINVSNYPFDRKLYQDVLDSELCQRQLQYLTGNNTGLMFRCKYFRLRSRCYANSYNYEVNSRNVCILVTNSDGCILMSIL